ncbi:MULTISPECIES: restriction endonuclease subunit S [unclassified Gordonia (in: high G+C Gram-positive bacteria)]|uniref:restriction endonuclease subunit S n=1 Tax=unclassified Gordonia (in: high G+C Gram-positive bacteria) TaxID=2657482 RepID=UPI0010FA3B1E|nr:MULTISPECIES: restriction endonuclease subunit S [unclassified Gordonia (in: high G+C Gram-positive bacteria)]
MNLRFNTTIGEVLEGLGGSLKTGPFGTTLKASEYAEIGGVPVVSVGEVGMGSLRIGPATPRVGEEVLRRLPEYVLQKGDIVFGRKGAVDRCALVRENESGYFLGSDGIRLRLPPSIDSEYLASELQSAQVCNWLRANSLGTTMPSLNQEILRRVPIRLPALVEQRQIAETLQDADNLISSIERLIAKKQAIKQGMMQQLLTGRTRLSTYCRQWEDRAAGDIGEFKGGSGFPIRFQGETSGEYPFYKVSDMNSAHNGLFMTVASNYISEHQRKQISAVVMPANAIIFAKVGAAVFLERKRILTRPSCVDNNMAAFTVDETRADVRFIYYLLELFPMSSLVATGALPSLNGRQLRSIPLSLPSDLAEQRAISSVLTDVDAELEVLRARAAKARDIKTGMMQQLLTGRTRLPVEAGS